MQAADILKAYMDSARLKQLALALKQENNRSIFLNGLGFSVAPIVTGALYQKQSFPISVCVLDNKENAAYFYNDLQNTMPLRDSVFFLPSSGRPYTAQDNTNTDALLRAEVISALAKIEADAVVVTYPEALAEKIVTKSTLQKKSLTLGVGEKISISFLEEILFDYEFEKTDFVVKPGQFAVRGGIVDLFSFAYDKPFRIEFFGKEVESIRPFNAADQLSTGKVKLVNIVPNLAHLDKGEEVRESLFNFLPQDTLYWFSHYDLSLGSTDKLFTQASETYINLEKLPTKHNTPEHLYLSKEALLAHLNTVHKLLFWGYQTPEKYDTEIRFNLKAQPMFNKNFSLLAENFKENKAQEFKNYIAATSAKQVERLYAVFQDNAQKPEFTPILFEINEGFIDYDLKIALYTDHQLFERYHRFRLKEGFKQDQQAITIKELSSLQPGDFVVHVDHGIGKFSGLEKILVGGKYQEAVRLVYRDNDILYVSIHSLHRISKYSGKEGTEPKIYKLGGAAWATLKKKTKNKVKEVAFDLIQLYAKRRQQKGFKFNPDNYLMHELEASFEYEETPDQLKAVNDVKRDMEQEMPMDRLVCGDVGFGKTEVAIRAAFKAVADSKQVAILVPTTVLSLQHYKSLKKRLADFPATVDYVNRFKSSKQIKETLKNLAEGKIDILVGTHRLVSKDVKFKDLGLLIIDEEQKFGVSVKDKLKTFKVNVDTLTLTATPIPRTLQFSLMNARDLSIINTPPPNRYPVETKLIGFNHQTIKEAIAYEISRDGQVFFVNNKIHNLHEIADLITKLVPGTRVAVGHGQMDGDKLEEIMTGFYEGIFDVLVCTTIVESGIDVSNANTIIINEAQNFGLSDLHQLRGRVGRSNKKAFCYLIAPPLQHVSSESRKRLEALLQFSDLGSGFNIAMRDLDIRGAGDLLGADQSGFISDIGFEMYQKILDEAIQELKETEFKELFEDEHEPQNYTTDCVIETDLELLFPDEYIIDITERLALYRALTEIKTEEELNQFRTNLIDRFGPLPLEAEELIQSLKLKWLGMEFAMEKIIIKSGKMICSFIENQESAFFGSDAFDSILRFVQTHTKTTKMYQKNNLLKLSIEQINSINNAIYQLNSITLQTNFKN
ncbi:MAG: transcription-repair coupling factor [Luteibaculaceae bacterium]